MEAERLQEMLARLDTERREADRLYNDGLTALDRALVTMPELPHPPPAYDESQLTPVNLNWDILPSGPPPIDGSLKGRLRGLVWRIAGPALETQKRFNAAVVDHLNRNAAAHREAQKAIASTLALFEQHLHALMQFQTHLIQFLQTVTLYMDTKDRASAGDIHVVNAALSALTDDWLKHWESLGAREQRFNARVASIDELRTTVGLAQQMALSLKREVERLLAAPIGSTPSIPSISSTDSIGSIATPDLNSYKYLGFEDAFRGSREEIRARLAEYVPKFAGLSDVLDIGCGRGEFLDLLREHGIRARGLDLNHEMAEVSRARGLDVTEGDALGYLTAQPDASLGGVIAVQVVEHLEPSYLMRLIETAFHKLRPGGLLVLETINPACWVAFFESYIRDLTHVRPLHPETLQYLLRASGFHDVTIEFRSPIAESARLQPVAAPAGEGAALADLVETVNENTAKLNARMFTFQDYAAIGRK